MANTFSAVAGGGAVAPGGGSIAPSPVGVWELEWPAIDSFGGFPITLEGDFYRSQNAGDSIGNGWAVQDLNISTVVSGGFARNVVATFGGVPLPVSARVGGGGPGGWLWTCPVFQTDIPAASLAVDLVPVSRVWTFTIDFRFGTASTGNDQEGIYIAPRSPTGAFNVQTDAPANIGSDGGAQISSDGAGNVVLNWYTAGGGLIDSTIIGAIGVWGRVTFVVQSTRPGREPTADVLDAAGTVLQARTFDGADLPRYLTDIVAPNWTWGLLSLGAWEILTRFRLSFGQFLPDGTAV